MPFDPRTLIDPVFFSRLESIELRAARSSRGRCTACTAARTSG